MTYESSFVVHSSVVPGVSLTIRRVSVARRLELLKQVRELTGRLEFYQAGASLEDGLSSSIASGEIESLYVLWGVSHVGGLMIDGLAATPQHLVESGPEELVREAASLIRDQLGLSDAERKN